MDYDPIKDRLGDMATAGPIAMRAFYAGLDTVFLRSWYVRRALRRLLRRVPSHRPIRVLDAGTGFGQYAHFLLRTYPNVTVDAVDVKQEYLDRAEAFFATESFAERVQFRNLDLTTELTDRNAYDLILSVDVMEHIEDDRAVFRNFGQAVKPGGFVIINTPSDLGGSGVAEEGDESFIGEHVRDGYSLEDITAKLEQAGLRLERHEYTYGPTGSVAWRILVQGPMKVLEANKAFAPLLAPYYAGALPVGVALNAADMVFRNRKGTGLLAIARRKAWS